MILTQTSAMLKDAFRELHARKLFWITMGLSLVVVGVFATLGLDKQKGVTVLIWTLPDTQDFAQRVTPVLFYRFWMIQIGIGFWLSWVAAIIALISTAGIIPSLVTSGTIDTMLSKPIGRVRLFLTKYVTGLLFVILQVGVFAMGCILVIGIRSGSWEWSLLLAVPIVTLFFSYLFSVSALVGIISKSALTSVLVTGLLWFMIFLVNMGDGIFLDIKSRMSFDRDYAEAQIEYQTDRINRLEAQLAEDEAEGIGDSRAGKRIETARERIERAEIDFASAEEDLPTVEMIHAWIFRGKTLLPKTGETIELLNRWLVDMSEIRQMLPGMFDADNFTFEDEEQEAEDSAATTVKDPSKVKSPAQRSMEETRARSLWWVIGSSLLFEAFVLGLCCVIFSRRDF